MFFFCFPVCEYYAHLECQDFAVPDCTENATYVPGKELLNVKHQVSLNLKNNDNYDNKNNNKK